MTGRDSGPRWARAWVAGERRIARFLDEHIEVILRSVLYTVGLVLSVAFAYLFALRIGIWATGDTGLLYEPTSELFSRRALRAAAYGSPPFVLIGVVLAIRHFAHRRVQEEER